MIRFLTQALPFGVYALTIVSAGQSLAADGLVGKRVLPKSPEVVIRQTASTQAPAVDYTIGLPAWKVQDTQDNWLCVGGGWVTMTDVVPIEQAIEYFTAHIAQAPTAYAYAARSRARLEGKDDIDSAASDADVALRMAPSSCHALFAKAAVFSKRGEPAKASACYELIIAAQPRCKDAYGRNAQSRLQEYAASPREEKYIDSGIDALSMGLQQWPNDATFLCMRALRYRLRGVHRKRDGHFEDAESDCTNSIRDWTAVLEQKSQVGAVNVIEECASSYSLRGDLRAAQSRPTEAITDFSRSLELSPSNPATLYLRGLTHGLNNKHRLAIADCKAAIELGLKDSKVYLAFGRSLLLAHELDEAIESLGESIRLDKCSSIAYQLRGRAWLK
jgi:tetratricopeptide (TPR) repeat protein